MAVTLPNATRTAACDAIVDLIEDGGGAGKLELLSAADAVLATITLNNPAFGAAVNGVATADNDPVLSATVGTSGTATKFNVKDFSGDTIFSGTVGTSGADIILTNNVLVETETVSIVSCTFTVPAS